MTKGLDDFLEGRPETLSVPEVAEILGLSKQSLYTWLRDGVIPGYKIGTTWFILRDELKETMRQGSNRPQQGDAP